MNRFERLLEAVPDALVGMDQKGVIRFVNRQTESLFGYDRDDLVGQPIEIIVPEPLWQIYAQNRDQYFADPITRSSGLEVELAGRRPDGSEFPVNITIAHIDTGDVLLVITAVSDVTRREKAVKDAKLMTAVVEYSNDAVISTNLRGIVTSWNPAAERMFGYSSREMTGRSAETLIPPDRADEFVANLARVRDDQPVEGFETVRVRKDGSLVPVSVTGAPIHDENSVIIGISAIYRDVTEQREAFEAAQKLAAIVAGSGDAIIGETLEGVITSWNPAATRMFGYSSEEIIGTSVSLLVPEAQAAAAQGVADKVRAGHHVENLETLNVRKDGTVFPISLTVSQVRGVDGAIVGASVICRDLSEKQRSALYARSLIEAALDPMLTISPEGKITDVNEATVKVTGVPRQEIIGTDFTSYFTEPDKAAQCYHQVLEQGMVTDYPLTIRHRDGTLTDVSYNASVYRDLGGAVLGVFAPARDVTLHKRAFEAAQNLAAIINSSDDAILSGSMDGLITSWNPAAERMYGYSRAEIIGSPATALVPKDHKSEIRDILKQVRAGHPVERHESERLRKDGSVFPVLLTVSAVRDADGAIVGTSVIHRDLSEQKGALAAAERIAAIVENSGDAIVGRTLDGTVTSWNPAAERMFGYSEDEIVGRSIQLLVPQEQAGEILTTLAAVSAGRSITDFETTRIGKDGKPLTVSMTTAPIRDHKGAVVSASVIYRDVTELQHAARYARSLIEAALDPLVTISPEGRIGDVNEATVRVTGVPRNKLIGTDFSQYFTDPDKAHEGYRRAFNEGSVTNYPLTLVHRDGSRTDVSYNASVYRDSSGMVLGVIAAARATTERT